MATTLLCTDTCAMEYTQKLNTKYVTCASKKEVLSKWSLQKHATEKHILKTYSSFLLVSSPRVSLSWGDWGDSPHYPKNWLVPHVRPTFLPKKCCFSNFHAVFGHFAQNMLPLVESKWETLSPGVRTKIIRLMKGISVYIKNYTTY